jgi:hypothetical protein
MVYIYEIEAVIVRRHRSIEAFLLEMSESHHSCDARPLLLAGREADVHVFTQSRNNGFQDVGALSLVS